MTVPEFLERLCLRFDFLNLHHPAADFFVPNEQSLTEALGRVTHLGIGAHQDDLEFMAFHGILECYRKDHLWFGGITCTDGARSSRSGKFERMSDEEMKNLRREEQRCAALLGEYAAMIQLDYPSSEIREPSDSTLTNDLRELLIATRPDVVYTHNPADKQGTHIAVVRAAIQAIRSLPLNLRPGKVIGCEVWRDLDWMPDEEKVIMDVSGGDPLASKLMECFSSQIAGGKRYDNAIQGRRLANASFLDPYKSDGAEQIIFGMDLTPLVQDQVLDMQQFVSGFIDRFHSKVKAALL